MCSVLVIGADAALLEGIAQTLATGGHQVCLAHSLGEGTELAGQARPLVVVVERRLAADDGMAVLGLPLARGGSFVLFRGAGDDRAALRASLERATLADLTLPLERLRLLALVQHVERRARAVGRGRTSAPVEEPRAP